MKHKLGKGNQSVERNNGIGDLTPFLTLTLDRGERLLHTSAASLLGKNSGLH